MFRRGFVLRYPSTEGRSKIETSVVLVAGVGAAVWVFGSYAFRFDNKIEALGTKLETRFDALDGKIIAQDGEFDSLGANMMAQDGEFD